MGEQHAPGAGQGGHSPQALRGRGTRPEDQTGPRAHRLGQRPIGGAGRGHLQKNPLAGAVG